MGVKINLNLFSLPTKREWKYIQIYFLYPINGSGNEFKFIFSFTLCPSYILQKKENYCEIWHIVNPRTFFNFWIFFFGMEISIQYIYNIEKEKKTSNIYCNNIVTL